MVLIKDIFNFITKERDNILFEQLIKTYICKIKMNLILCDCVENLFLK